MKSALLLLLLTSAVAPLVTPVAAQTDSTPLPPVVVAPHSIRVWEGAAVIGGLGLSLFLDQSLRNTVQANRTTGKDNIATVFRHMGQPEVYGTIGLGTIAVGLLANRSDITRAGARISSSILLAGILAGGAKLTIGRYRPFESPNQPFHFRPLSGHDAMPSGHSTLAFALATSVSREVHQPLVSVLLFTAAAGTGWSRINDDKHWLSDVLAGAVLGIASAQFIEGKWTIFGVRPPHVLMTPAGTGIGWSGTF